MIVVLVNEYVHFGVGYIYINDVVTLLFGYC